jgi:hypothetical protein
MDHTTSLTPLPYAVEMTRHLEESRRSRGFLLPHQGLMAAAMPDLQDASAVMYRAETLTDRHLTHGSENPPGLPF